MPLSFGLIAFAALASARVSAYGPAPSRSDPARGGESPELVFSHPCNRRFRCDACQGDCDGNNSLCGPGLLCFERKGSEAVPGCSGEGRKDVQFYCYDPKKADQTNDLAIETFTPDHTNDNAENPSRVSISTTVSATTGTTLSPNHDPTTTPSLSPNIALSSNPPATSPPVSAASVPTMLQTVAVPLTPMTMSLTFFASRRRLAPIVVAVNEDELLRVAENALTDSFSSVYSLFERVDLGMDWYEMLEVSNNATASFGLIGSVHFVESPNWKLPSQDDLDNFAMSTLNSDEFRDMLQKSEDPVLSSIHGIEIIASAPEEGGTDGTGTVPVESRGGGSHESGDRNHTLFKALLAVATVISFAALVTLGFVFIRRKRSRTEKNVDKDDDMTPDGVARSTSTQSLELTPPSSPSPPSPPLPIDGSIICPGSVDASELSMGTWDNMKSNGQISIQSVTIRTPGFRREDVEEENNASDDDESLEPPSIDRSSVRSAGSSVRSAGSSVRSGGRRTSGSRRKQVTRFNCNRSIDNRSIDPSIISFGTDGMSATGLARIDEVIMDINTGYDEETLDETQEVDGVPLQDWLKQRQEIEEELDREIEKDQNAVRECKADLRKKRYEIKAELYDTENGCADDTFINDQADAKTSIIEEC